MCLYLFSPLSSSSLSLLLSITYLVLQFHEFPPVLTRDLRAQLVPKGIGGRGGVRGDREEESGEGGNIEVWKISEVNELQCDEIKRSVGKVYS